jgi:hypothetical protein
MNKTENAFSPYPRDPSLYIQTTQVTGPIVSRTRPSAYGRRRPSAYGRTRPSAYGKTRLPRHMARQDCWRTAYLRPKADHYMARLECRPRPTQNQTTITNNNSKAKCRPARAMLSLVKTFPSPTDQLLASVEFDHKHPFYGVCCVPESPCGLLSSQINSLLRDKLSFHSFLTILLGIFRPIFCQFKTR